MFATSTLGPNHATPARTYSCSNNFSHLNGFSLYACGKLHGYIGGLLHLLGTKYRWCVAAFCSRSGSGWPSIIGSHQDRLIVQAGVAAQIASTEEIQAHIAPAESPRTIGTRLLAAGLRSCMPLTRLSLTPRHGQARQIWCETVHWRVEWRSVVFSDESRFCVYVSTRVWRRPGERHLPEYIRPRHTGFTSGFMVWGPSVNSRSYLVFLQGKVISVCYIAEVVNPLLLPLLRQEGDVLFQQDNAQPHTSSATQLVFVVYLASKIPRSLTN